MNKKHKKILLWVVDLLLNVAVIVILVVVIQKWLIAPFDVSGASMCDTLNNIDGECKNSFGEKIIINEAGYIFNDPRRGEIVVFKAPEEGKYFIKRIIGLPGETVEIHNGEVYVKEIGAEESIKIEEPYLNEQNRGQTKSFFSGFSVFEVPEDQYFVLGDNRKASTDSRSCFQSTISLNCKNNPEKAYINRDAIRGKAWVVWWPLSNMRTLDTPVYESLDQSTSESLEEK